MSTYVSREALSLPGGRARKEDTQIRPDAYFTYLGRLFSGAGLTAIHRGHPGNCTLKRATHRFPTAPNYERGTLLGETLVEEALGRFLDQNPGET